MIFVSSNVCSQYGGGVGMPAVAVCRARARRLSLICSLILAIALGFVVALPSIASAANNIAPSSAKGVSLGVPFTGGWAGTKHVTGRGYTHWWRLPGVVRPSDEVGIAVDNGSSLSVEICLVSPVDDFDANAALSSCRTRSFSSGVQARASFTYEGTTGQPYLVVRYGCCNLSGSYTLTVERIVTAVNIGMVVPARLPASFLLAANLAYGDNTPAGDGIPAVLQWRYLPTSKGNPPPFADVATGTSVGGTVTFAATMPPEAQGGTVQLRACVAQPGGDSGRCGAASRATVAVSACARALASRRAKTRAVRKLKRKLRRARARGRVKPRMRLRMKQNRRQLAKAKRSVRAHC